MIKGTTKGDKYGDEKGAKEIAEEDEKPVFEELRETDFAVEKSHEHKVVPGEELAAGNDDHGEASGENTSAGKFAAVGIAEGGAGGS